MIKNVLMALVLLSAVFFAAVVLQPSEFRITRSQTMAASAEEVFAQINDFRKWEAWSPWAKMDPNASAEFTGPETSVGSSFAWSGNDQVGAGRQTIVESRPNELIRIKLEFTKPFQAVNTTDFLFKEDNGQTTVTWSMFGHNNFMAKAMGLIMNCDKMVGGQFEKGLADLKALVEQ